MINRILWGLIISVFGIGLAIVGLVVKGEAKFLLYYGGAILIVGLFIIFNRREDKIEQIKSSRR